MTVPSGKMMVPSGKWGLKSDNRAMIFATDHRFAPENSPGLVALCHGF
jgi:hypothetical protein